jgi:threonyl-tRNA synthetase
MTSRTEAYGALLDLQRLRGTDKSVAAILDTDDAAHLQQLTVMGLFDELIPLTDDELPYYDVVIRITEL